MIHVAVVDKSLFDILEAPQNRYPGSTEIDGKYEFIDGDEIVFMSNNEFSKKYKVLYSKYEDKKTYVEFY